MESSSNDVVHDFPHFFKVYKDGRIERHRYADMDFVPTGLDPNTGVQTKDVLVRPDASIKARIFLPKIHGPSHKLPLLVHYHGGGFCIGSSFDSINHKFLTTFVSLYNVIAISIEYRLAPENPLPIAYEDSWAGLQWVSTHSNGAGPEPWLNQHTDFGRVLLDGESAGANIAHYVAVQAGITQLAGMRIVGMLIVHPFFGGKERNDLYKYMCPTSSGCDDDPKLNPAVDPNLKSMGCERVIVMVAEKDFLRAAGVAYYETLKNSDWEGTVEFYESEGEDHCFHLFNPNSENARPVMNKMSDFIKQN